MSESLISDASQSDLSCLTSDTRLHEADFPEISESLISDASDCTLTITFWPIDVIVVVVVGVVVYN